MCMLQNALGITSVEIDLRNLPNVKAYLDSILKCDEQTLRRRLAELEAEKWTIPQWNLAGIAARTMLLRHPAYSSVLQVIQRRGGF